jgi:hypothetical protein
VNAGFRASTQPTAQRYVTPVAFRNELEVASWGQT